MVPYVGTEQMKKNVTDLKNIQNRLDNMYEIFLFFTNGEWLYVNKNIYNVINKLSDDEKDEFQCDVTVMDWRAFLTDYVKGLAIWVLK